MNAAEQWCATVNADTHAISGTPISLELNVQVGSSVIEEREDSLAVWISTKENLPNITGLVTVTGDLSKMIDIESEDVLETGQDLSGMISTYLRDIDQDVIDGEIHVAFRVYENTDKDTNHALVIC